MPIVILIIILSLYFFFKAIKSNNFLYIITSLTILVFTSQVQIIQYWLTAFSFICYVFVVIQTKPLVNWKHYAFFLTIISILFIIDSYNLLTSVSLPHDIYKTKVLYFYITMISYFSIFFYVIRTRKHFISVLYSYFIIVFIEVSITGLAKYFGYEFLNELFTKEKYELSLMSNLEDYINVFRFYDAYKNSPVEICLLIFPVIFLSVLKKNNLAFAFSTISVFIILLTLSRTGVVAILVFMIFYTILRNKKNQTRLFVSLLVILTFMYFIILQINLKAIDERLASMQNVDVRLETMAAYLNHVFTSDNLFGYSENLYYMSKKFKLPYAISSESLYLTIFVEKGLVGGGLLVSYLLISINKLRKIKIPFNFNVNNTVLVYFICVVYTSLIILFSFYYSPNDIHFWFLIIMSNILFEIESKKERRTILLSHSLKKMYNY